ncbi:hypothetical protein scyTo_0004900 [Scyliorhinus torazame]|uniref:WD repeat and FYVE domain-containing protein 3 n=1 Tax=Scyliorhinus torazame TaxID=75743 RepID=A0A401NYY8_SCYTO|nr:hypothetical protein [Scyliorhinus torazame]
MDHPSCSSHTKLQLPLEQSCYCHSGYFCLFMIPFLSIEAASRAIVQFLEINQIEESSRGWMLLTTLNLLASSGQKTVDYMTTMSLPSTLVKCLYLFFDLPHVPDVPGGAQSDLSLSERRALLQKVFVQILVKLCKYVSPAEELAQKDDLQLLFSAITSWCPPHNILWRKSAGELSHAHMDDPLHKSLLTFSMLQVLILPVPDYTYC